MDNVAVVVKEGSAGSRLLGRYDGIPLTERDASYAGMVMPDRITLFRRPLLAVCGDEEELVEQVRITVIHEVRSEEHTSELQSLMRSTYAVFCWKKKTTRTRSERAT